MNLNQITAFRAVMTSASISQAARKLGRTQPAVSLAVKSLEDSLGMRLFERQGRRLIPVPEAQYLLAESEAILNRLATVSQTMTSMASGRSGTLNVSAMPGGIYMFSRFISQAIGNAADVSVTISARSSGQIHEQAGSQSIDFGFGDAPPTPQDNAPYLAEIIHGDCVCAMARSHPLASAKSIAAVDLEGVPMGTMQKGHVNYERTSEMFARARVRITEVIDSQTFLPLLQFVNSGFCVAIVDPLTVVTERELDSCKDGVVFKPLTDKIRYDYAILSPRYRPASQLARAIREDWRAEFLRMLEEVGARPQLAVTQSAS